MIDKLIELTNELNNSSVDGWFDVYYSEHSDNLFFITRDRRMAFEGNFLPCVLFLTNLRDNI